MIRNWMMNQPLYRKMFSVFFFFFNDPATTEIYTLSLHDALPIFKPGVKAVHIHSVARCDPPAFESAGPHFNPGNTQHGLENPKGPHAGDLPNIEVDATGLGHLEFTNSRVSLESGPTYLLGPNGSSIVVHESADDMRTDPAGNSGARVACGVIVRAG